MPSGVYVRRGDNIGKTLGVRSAIVEATKVLSSREVARLFGVSHGTVCKLKIGDWNPGRKRKI